MFMTGSQSRHQRQCVRDHNVYVRPAIPTIWHQRRRARDATDFYESMMIHSRIESPSVLIQGIIMHMNVLVRYIGTGCIFLQNRESARTNTGYAYESFSKVYWNRMYFVCAPSGLWQGQVFDPQRHPPSKWKSSAPPPPGKISFVRIPKDRAINFYKIVVMNAMAWMYITGAVRDETCLLFDEEQRS